MTALSRRLASIGLVALFAITLSACKGNSEEFPEVVLLGDGDIFPSINNSSLSVGDNRISMSIIDADDAAVLGADVRLRFYDLSGAKPLETSEAQARFVHAELGFVDEQSGGTREVTGEGGVYVANASFSHAGAWGVKVKVTTGGRTLKEAPFRFNVLDDSSEPSIGDSAPASRQQVLANVADIEEIDSSSPPRPAMHDRTIADAIARGKPTVIAFATPAYCRSRTCAPVMDTVMDPLAAEFAGRATFIHVEPYILRDLRNGFVQNPAPAVLEWRIQSEPWIFVVGADGRVVAKFEGITAADEVRDALTGALAPR